MRSLYILGLGYTAVCGLVAYRMIRPAPVVQPAPGPTPVTPPAPQTAGGAGWFQQMKPFCNAVEVETMMRQTPPPAGTDGAGYGAACYALAGRIDQARRLIADLPAGNRGTASATVFEIGHPVADAGDDRSAGPIMELVIEFWPDNYMALYHAGMSEYALGQPELSATHLRRFLELYKNEDGWRSNGIDVLGRLEAAGH